MPVADQTVADQIASDQTVAEETVDQIVADKKAAQVQLRKDNEASRKAAQTVLFQFQDTKPYAKLPENVQDAIKRLSSKPSATKSGGFPSAVSVLSVLFPEIGATLDEMDVFKRTKKGRSEFRKFCKLGLLRAKAADRMWVSFDEAEELYTLIGIGEEAPEGYNGPGVPVKKVVAEAVAE